MPSSSLRSSDDARDNELAVYGRDPTMALEDFAMATFMSAGSHRPVDQFLPSKPGTERIYSDDAYALAGYALERVVQEPFERYVPNRDCWAHGPAGGSAMDQRWISNCRVRITRLNAPIPMPASAPAGLLRLNATVPWNFGTRTARTSSSGRLTRRNPIDPSGEVGSVLRDGAPTNGDCHTRARDVTRTLLLVGQMWASSASRANVHRLRRSEWVRW